jgi:hypothetical protein
MAKKPTTNNKINDRNTDISLKALKEKLIILKEINDAMGYESSLSKTTSDIELQKLISAKQLFDLEQKLNKEASNKSHRSKKELAVIKNQIKQQIIQARLLDRELNKQLTTLTNQQKVINNIKTSVAQFANKNFGFGAVWTYLMESDKAVKTLNLSLGLSGSKADEMSTNIKGASTYAQRLGVSIADLAKMQTEYSNETQKTVALTQKEFELVTNIAKGTALGVDSAGKLVGQFDLLGVSVKTTEGFVQGVVDTSERMGINATKVLKNLSQNFKRLNTFSFKDGIKGMAKMSEYSEKFKLDINDSINSAKMAKSLEGAIEMAAQLNVLGGEFSKTDPFELLFLSRNDPAEYTKKIAQMTKGMASLKKTEDGFEFDITAQDQDRLRLAADALGVSYENLAESARRVAQEQKKKQATLGLNLTKDEKEYIEGITKFDTKTGKFFAMVNGAQKDISKLSTSDIELLKQESITLEKRAVESQTFEDVMKNTMLEMKSALLPVLDAINWALGGINDLKDWIKSLIGDKGMKWTAGLAIGGFALFKAFKLAQKIPGIGGLFGGAGKTAPTTAPTAGGIGGGAGKGIASAGAAKSIAAVGVAAVGIGAGVGLAALGISKLAEAFKGLDVKQIDGINSALKTLGVIMIGTLAVGLIAIGIAGAAASEGLLVIGVAALAIGAGIGIAAAGIGYMAKGLSELTQNADGTELLGIAGGIAAIGAATFALAGGGIIGAIGGAGALGMILAIASQGDNLMKVGEAFKNIGVVMNGSADQFERVEKAITNIANAKLDSNSIFGELKQLLSKPLQVVFADKSVAIKSDITLEINRERLVKLLDIGKEAVIQTVRHQQGSSSAGVL